MDKTRTKVKICGKEYTMAGYESEEYIHRVAICVDRKMAELKGQYVNLNPGTLSVLTAINIADDLIKLQQRYDELEKEYEKLSEQTNSGSSEEIKSNVSPIKKTKIFDGYK